MKNLTMNHQTNIVRTILSRLKETVRGLISMSDGNKYCTQDTDIQLPSLLKTSIQKLNLRATKYTDNGIILEFPDIENPNFENTQVNRNNNSNNIETKSTVIKPITKTTIDNDRNITLMKNNGFER